MTRAEILAGVAEVARQHLGRGAPLEPDQRLVEDLGLDSLQSMELLSRLSERYAIDPDIDQLLAIRTLGEVRTTLGRYLEIPVESGR